ncbi:MAG: ComEC/Rec2 family competence protein [Flammeovirgaceae bacterium]|nr:ComEC/Rec2 family competence protein [Flammeovirgaceae bacterium]
MAKPFGHRTNIYNTLAASAFVLLLVNPYLIMSVGFQLSYLAVLGIVYVQAPLYRLWEIDNAFGDWVWKITTVSIAAQLATFALGLLYFHQFPVYFLFSNLFVIPGAFVILLLGIGLLIFSFWSVLAAGIGKLLSLAIYIVNQGVFFIEGLPFSLLSDIYINTLQSWLLIGVVVLILLVFDVKKFQFMYGAFVLSIGFFFAQHVNHRSYVKPASLSVYSINGYGAVDFIQNSRSYLFTDSALLSDEDRVRFHIRPNRVRSGVRKRQSL